MKNPATSQSMKALALLAAQGMVRSSEFTAEGITATTIRRLEAKGQVTRLVRGLYGLPDARIETHHSLAEAAKRVPKGTVCLSSALAFHELTDAVPSRVWLALGPKDWAPKSDELPLQIVRFGPKVLTEGIETHEIAGVAVHVYSPAKTIVDLFRYRQSEGTRYRRSPGLALAIEGLREGLRTGKAKPAAIAAFADTAGVWKVLEPYLDALTAHA